jgi:hypothetical protein
VAAVPATSDPGTNLGFITDEEVMARRVALAFTRAYDGKVCHE